MKQTRLPSDLERVALSIMDGLATPTSALVRGHIEAGRWDDLSVMKVDPLRYSSAEAYFSDVQAVSFLRKCESLDTTVDRKAAAVDNFWHAERDCYRTNERLSPYLDGVANPTSGDVADRVLQSARKKIADVLGPFPDTLIAERSRFGPGATYGDRGRLTTIPDKMSSQPTLTSEAYPYLFPWCGTLWAKACGSSGKSPIFVRGNRFTTVPKDCTKNRGIAVEPSINLFFQLGLGSVLKERIGRAGLDLQHAQDIHKQVACEASIRGHLATIDLSNASDTVCKNLVKLLLPPRWFEAFNSLRSPTTLIEGRVVHLEKFSSMGNGYTFELETLIFASLCHAVMDIRGRSPIWGFDLFVFGDDIIVPTDVAQDVLAALRFFGFTPNANKTFVDGPFRESCGGDYFMGVDVRPYFLKDFPSEPQEYIAMANGLRRVADPDTRYSGRWHDLRRSWFCILDAIPSSVRRCRGPTSLGDIVIHDVYSNWGTRWRNCIRYINVYRPCRWKRVGWNHFRPDVVLATAVLGVGDGRMGVTPRDAVTGFKNGWVAYS